MKTGRYQSFSPEFSSWNKFQNESLVLNVGAHPVSGLFPLLGNHKRIIFTSDKSWYLFSEKFIVNFRGIMLCTVFISLACWTKKASIHNILVIRCNLCFKPSGPKSCYTMHRRTYSLAYVVTACVSAACGTRTAPSSSKLQCYPQHTSVYPQGQHLEHRGVLLSPIKCFSQLSFSPIWNALQI